MDSSSAFTKYHFHFIWFFFYFIFFFQKNAEEAENDETDDIAYAPQNSDGSDEYDAQQQIQYVTPQQYEQLKQRKCNIGRLRIRFELLSFSAILPPLIHSRLRSRSSPSSRGRSYLFGTGATVARHPNCAQAKCLAITVSGPAAALRLRSGGCPTSVAKRCGDLCTAPATHWISIGR